MADPGLSVVIPIYNEKDGVGETIAHLQDVVSAMESPIEVLLVDDGSTDGTQDVLSAVDSPHFRVLRHRQNRGYGAAIKTGTAAAAHDYICITDADGTYPNDRIPELFDRMVEADLDMLVGARTQKDCKIPLIRRPPKWALRRLACYLSGADIPDLNSGLRIMRKDVLQSFTRILPDGFSLTTTITLATLTSGHDVVFTPISYQHRAGQSKIRPIRDTLNFIQLIFRTVLFFEPMRVFGPISFALMLAATGAYGMRLAAGEGYGVTVPMLFLSGLQLLGIGMLAELIVKRLDVGRPTAATRQRDGA